MGLDKYIPEFTVNQINGTKFLDLDGNKLKVISIHNFITISFSRLKKDVGFAYEVYLYSVLGCIERLFCFIVGKKDKIM